MHGTFSDTQKIEHIRAATTRKQPILYRATKFYKLVRDENFPIPRTVQKSFAKFLTTIFALSCLFSSFFFHRRAYYFFACSLSNLLSSLLLPTHQTLTWPPESRLISHCGAERWCKRPFTPEIGVPYPAKRFNLLSQV